MESINNTHLFSGFFNKDKDADDAKSIKLSKSKLS